MSVLSNLDPAPLWIYFEEICKIPRISKNEGRIRKYLLDFAMANNLEAKEDETGNILITRPASPGHERIKTIVLQSHMDMVGEKNADHPHDWEKDPVIPVLKEEWVTASGTTLGADDGIGIAAQLAILADKDMKAGRIECLFTVDEETGMTGVLNLDHDFFSGRTLLNLDSEDEGILFIGSAGGMDTVGTMSYKTRKTGIGFSALEISLTGLHGGHSGDEIHKGYGNSVKIMCRILKEISEQNEISLAHFSAGNLRNAIPREAFSTIVLHKQSVEEIKAKISRYQSILLTEFGNIERDLKISASEVAAPEVVMDNESKSMFLGALECCPHGPIAWSKDIDDLVETSTNLASAKFSDNNTIKIVTTQRSSVESAKHEVAAIVESCLKAAGADVVKSDGYPGWKPDLNSEILKITSRSYRELFGKEPYITAIHAGLECGLLYEKIKGIDMISFGPTIRGAHTPEERIEIKTVRMFWDLLLDVIKKMPSD